MIDFAKQASDIAERIAQKVKQDQDQEVLKQCEERKCNVIPLPKVATQPFRSELTLERHPLFVVNSFKGDHIIHQRTVEHPESKEPIEQRVIVGKSNDDARPLGVLKQAHQEVFYRLLQIWGEQGYRIEMTRGVIEMTAYDLVIKIMGNDSSRNYKRLHNRIRELSSIPISIANAYTWQGISDVEEFALLDGLRWRSIKLDKETSRPEKGEVSRVKISFSETITEGFLRKNIKQLLWQPYASLGRSSGRRAEIARLLYPILDHELSSKEHYHVSLSALIKRLGMRDYAYRSKRKERIDPAVRELQSKPILAEKYQLDLKLVDSADKQDYILQARRSAYQLSLQGL